MPLPQRVRIAEQLIRRIEWGDLDRAAIRQLAQCARDETLLGHGLLPQGNEPRPADSNPGKRTRTPCSVDLIASADLVACGAALAPIVLLAFGCDGVARPRVSDGSWIKNGSVITTIAGDATSLGPAVEVLRSFIRRLSGIATRTRLHVDALGMGRARLLDTGFATPGWMALEKYASACGGSWSAGTAWYDRVQISGNLCNSTDFASATQRHRDTSPLLPIEITIRSLSELGDAVDAGPDVIRLDGFTIPQIRRATKLVNGRVFLEAHGGITLSRVSRYSGLGLDFVSVEELASAAPWAPVTEVWRK